MLMKDAGKGMGGGSESSKDGYVVDPVDKRLEITKNLGI